MGKASVPSHICDDCGYRPKWSDTKFIPEHKVTHVICYNCGTEWVE